MAVHYMYKNVDSHYRTAKTMLFINSLKMLDCEKLD